MTTTINELRDKYTQLRSHRIKNVRHTIEHYVHIVFIKGHRPWKAVLGNENCRPIPIHRDFINLPYSAKNNWHYYFEFPNITMEMLKNELINLGFVITDSKYLCICVPPCKKGEKLSFAQEIVKKVNYEYSLYCKEEYDLAKSLYSLFLSDLMNAPLGQVMSCSKYTIFYDFKFSFILDGKIKKHFNKLSSSDKIEEYFECNCLVGVRLFH